MLFANSSDLRTSSILNCVVHHCPYAPWDWKIYPHSRTIYYKLEPNVGKDSMHGASGLIETTLVSEIITSSARLETHVVSFQYFDTEICHILTH